MALHFIFRLMLYSREDVLFDIIRLNVLKDIKHFFLDNVVQEKPAGTPFKGDDIKALIKTSNLENLVLYFSDKVKKSAVFAMLFWFSVTKQSLENGFGFPQ